MNETMAVNAYLRSVLTGDAGITAVVSNRVFCDVAPVGTASPLVIYTLLDAEDVNGQGGGNTVLSHLRYSVRCVCEGASYTPLVDVGTRLQAVLHGRHNVVSNGWLIQGIQRERALQYPEIVGNRQYRHLGGVYRVFINKAE